jgi:hypothetical protein
VKRVLEIILGRPRRRKKDHIKMDLRELGFEEEEIIICSK